MTTEFIFGLDLGQSNDYSALVILHHRTVVPGGLFMPFASDRGDNQRVIPQLHIVHIERYALGTPYTAIVTSVKRLTEDRKASPNTLVVDATGVGKAVVDMFRGAGLAPVEITITGGRDERPHALGFNVPKRNLVAAIQSRADPGKQQLRIAKNMQHVDILRKELLAFRMKTTKTGHDQYEAWREGDHDDLVLATAIAVWYANRMIREMPSMRRQPLKATSGTSGTNL